MVSRIVGAGRPGEISANAKLLLDGIKGHGSSSKPEQGNGHVVDINF